MSDYGKYAEGIWVVLLDGRFGIEGFGNEFAVAGLMGWWYGESGLMPFRCEKDYAAGYEISKTITARINEYANPARRLTGIQYFSGLNAKGNGWTTLTDFKQFWSVGSTKYGPGYGLAQWTTSSKTDKRKYNLFNFLFEHRTRTDIGIDNYAIQSAYALWEFKNNYGTLFNKMQNCTTVREAVNYAAQYEGAASWNDHSEQALRDGQILYNYFALGQGTPTFNNGDDVNGGGASGNVGGNTARYKAAEGMPLWMFPNVLKKG